MANLVGGPINYFLPIIALFLVQVNERTVYLVNSVTKDSYDYVVIGGGSGGATVSARLAEAGLDTLLIEAGPTENLLSDIPLAAATMQKTNIDWGYQTEPQKNSCWGLQDRRSNWPRGKVLGGSSVLNYMLYVRGNANDYNNWSAKYKLAGWSYQDVLPLFIKSEDNQDSTVQRNGSSLFHLRLQIDSCICLI
jgi:choline dehydrogenase-like flavoprotein